MHVAITYFVMISEGFIAINERPSPNSFIVLPGIYENVTFPVGMGLNFFSRLKVDAGAFDKQNRFHKEKHYDARCNDCIIISSASIFK